MGRRRTMSICLTDIPKERITKHDNGKLYLQVSAYDFDKPDQYDNDFSLSLPLTKEEQAKKKAGEKVQRVFIGNGRIWPDQGMQAATEEDTDDLPF